ncbi:MULTISPECIES: hypothetical protein [Paenibacillus]|uniref:Uncharacterized protein n=1 Tax=Paenibacillus radicis (ex Xue et al. 2023) TaxID=2972489 RepID=A0ABT1YQA9_9BACL|nr:hypothetical protein [Paenibacillus radicis (ex Xue et al. 2023)]MCR8634468.1 hypothetical protein [Paenibacillus radicis (ex Xue et al. 2023)]
MDKRKVIMAYRRGFITIQECAQILGVDSLQIMGLVDDPEPEPNNKSRTAKKHSVNG